jgi:uncharacterized protein YigE (DUF2233 family)
MKYLYIIICLIVLLPFAMGAGRHPGHKPDEKIISRIVDPHQEDIRFYWKNDSGTLIGNIGNLRQYLGQKNRRLIFAMNGGMFKPDYSPVGLFIQDGRPITALDTASGTGNFYLKPNGVFYLTKTGNAMICQTKDFPGNANVRVATQSGPMLLIDGQIHPAFKEGSSNLNIRNGVGLLPDNRLLFALSKEPINFYDFADFFKAQGCKNALYLDGFVSKAYLPEKNWEQTDGSLGPIIAVSIANTH